MMKMCSSAELCVPVAGARGLMTSGFVREGGYVAKTLFKSGEALAEVTAARVRFEHKQSPKSSRAQDVRLAKTQQWFSHPVEVAPRPQKKQPKHNQDLTMPL